MSAGELEDFYVLTVTTEAPGVEGPWGAEPGATSPPLRCFIDDTRRLIRDAQGTEVVSESVLTAPKELLEHFPVGARVNLPHRKAEVVAVGVAESGDLDLPDHLEAYLT